MAKGGDKPVFSTNRLQSIATQSEKHPSYQPGNGPCKVRLETKGRAGKTVTVLFNIPVAEAEARRLMQTMQSQFGCGATLKDSTIELRGDWRDKVEAYLQSLGIKCIRAGG